MRIQSSTAFALCCVLAPVRGIAAPAADLSWLEGCWVGREGLRTVEEQWTRPLPGLLLGSNRTREGQRLVTYEHLRIELGARPAYTAWPKGQRMTAFRLLVAERDHAAFENPRHDMPRRIDYRRDGAMLRVAIEGAVHGKPARRSWTWRRREEGCAVAPQRAEVVVEASLEQVWRAWTTVAGLRAFFAPEARVEPRPGGAYELYFMPGAPLGARGSEGCTIVELEAPRRLSFTWNFPPKLTTLRDAQTLVTLALAPVGPRRTRVTLTQSGWRQGEDWEQGRRYFADAWRGVLAQLRARLGAPARR